MLERWKAALEKNGLPCDLAIDTLQVEFPGPKYWVLREANGWNWFDANFREAVKNHVWQPTCCFVWTSGKCWLVKHVGHIDPVSPEAPSQVALIGTILGRGDDQNEALLNALEGTVREG